MRINVIEDAHDVNENCHSRRMIQKTRFNIGDQLSAQDLNGLNPDFVGEWDEIRYITQV